MPEGDTEKGRERLMAHLLEVKDVTKIYEGGVLANHNVNFTVEEGEIHALVGENGAGKEYADEDALRIGKHYLRSHLYEWGGTEAFLQ